MISRVAIGAAALAVALVAGACNRHGGQPRQRKATEDPTFAQDVERPALTIAAREHDFGEVLRGDELRHTFDIANLGRFPLHVHFDIGSVCSTGTDERRLEPGQRGRVDVVCRPAMTGPMLEVIVVRSSHDTQSPVTEQVGLVLKADVKPAVVFDRQSVTLRVALGKTAEQEVRLVGARASEVQLGRPRVELLAPDSASSRPLADGTTLRIDKLPAAAHKAAGLRLRFTGRITGTQSGRIVIPTGIDHPAEVDLALTLSVAAKT